jgi:hypothetical protein
MLIETLGDAFNAGWRVHARCARPARDAMKSARPCTFRAELCMQTLVMTRGRAFPLGLLAERLRCPRCGSREVAVIYDPPAGTRQAAAADR